MSKEFRSFLQRPHRSTAPTSYRLTKEDASIVKGMLLRGDKQHDIATYFGVNGGRIAEVSAGARFRDAPIAHSDSLPPPGPYHVRRLLAENKRLRDNR